MRSVPAFAALALLALAVPRLQAQQAAKPAPAAAARPAWPLAPGTWTGTMVPPNGQTLEVTYEVARVGDSVAVKLTTPMGTFPLRSVRLEQGHLRFAWTIDEDLTCDLAPDAAGAGFAGQCVDLMGSSGQLSMVPPAPAAPAAQAK